MGDSIVEVVGLRKAYGGAAGVMGISFEVEQGEVFGLLGPPGSGTTTVIECLQGLRIPDSGMVRVLGLDPASQRLELRRRIGAHPEHSGLPDRIRVGESLRLFASFCGRRVDWKGVMARWGLAGQAKLLVEQLTDRERLRLVFALALVNRPELVFLDDVSAGLDPGARSLVPELLRRVRDEGTTVVLATHEAALVGEPCDRVAILERGRLVGLGRPPVPAFDTAQGPVLAGTAPRVRSGHLVEIR